MGEHIPPYITVRHWLENNYISGRALDPHVDSESGSLCLPANMGTPKTDEDAIELVRKALIRKLPLELTDQIFSKRVPFGRTHCDFRINMDGSVTVTVRSENVINDLDLGKNVKCEFLLDEVLKRKGIRVDAVWHALLHGAQDIVVRFERSGDNSSLGTLQFDLKERPVVRDDFIGTLRARR